MFPLLLPDNVRLSHQDSRLVLMSECLLCHAKFEAPTNLWSTQIIGAYGHDSLGQAKNKATSRLVSIVAGLLMNAQCY